MISTSEKLSSETEGFFLYSTLFCIGQAPLAAANQNTGGGHLANGFSCRYFNLLFIRKKKCKRIPAEFKNQSLNRIKKISS